MSDYSGLRKLATTCSIARASGWQGKMGVDENQILNLLDQIEAQNARIIELANAANAARDEAEALRKALKTIREESHDIGACECAADALADAAKNKETPSV